MNQFSQKEAELLPCPFCGDHAETNFIPEHHSYAIECHGIGCAARIIKETAADAIEAWNRRAPAATVPHEWMMVPKIPTQEMCDAAKYTVHAGLSVFKWADGYYAMLAAAPHPPEASQARVPLSQSEANQLWNECLKKYKRPGPYELIAEFCANGVGSKDT